jgi:hypothetical protein
MKITTLQCSLARGRVVLSVCGSCPVREDSCWTLAIVWIGTYPRAGSTSTMNYSETSVNKYVHLLHFPSSDERNFQFGE